MNWIHAIIAIVVVLGGVLTTCMYLIWIERKLRPEFRTASAPTASVRSDCCNRWPTASSSSSKRT